MTLILRVECDDLVVNEVINDDVNLLQKIRRITELMGSNDPIIELIVIHERYQYTIDMNLNVCP